MQDTDYMAAIQPFALRFLLVYDAIDFVGIILSLKQYSSNRDQSMGQARSRFDDAIVVSTMKLLRVLEPRSCALNDPSPLRTASEYLLGPSS